MRLRSDWLLADGPRAVIAAIADAGHEAWFVGGCVRNAIIGAGETDIDIATDARPERVMALARAAGLAAVPTGIEHGTVTVVAGGTGYEVTTFRRDVSTDGRRATVDFATGISEDARRRDFTMNALYADVAGEVADPLGGLPDLLSRRVRFIGDPHDRIREDYLRILRFFRFHAWFGDPAEGLDADGLAACAELADGLAILSRERVTSELLRLLAAPDPGPSLAAMSISGVLHRVVPGAHAEAVPPLVHVEQQAGFAADALRRLVALGGSTEDLRLSRQERRRFEMLRHALDEGSPAVETAYRQGAAMGCDLLILRAAAAGCPVDPAAVAEAQEAEKRVFPVRAADLMPGLAGEALGRRLAELERRWIASGFTLDRAALLLKSE